MANPKTYQFPAETDLGSVVERLGAGLNQWFQQQEYETQFLPAGEGRAVVQAKKGKGFVQSLVPSALTVDITARDGKLVVQWGNAKWGLQAATGIVSLIIFWPVAALPAWSAYKQKQLIDGALDFVGQNIAALGGSEVMPTMVLATPAPAAPKRVEPATTLCPNCGQKVAEGAKFCPNCGTTLVAICANCGKNRAAGAKFCPTCGTSTGAGE
jgi:RNA polymerase subunit RPABC4/transcription elongation factor Spt4